MRRLILLALLAAAPLAAQRPSVPYVDEGVCPFECCTYREWTARNVIRAYPEPRRGVAPAFTLRPGERFRALTGHVRFDSLAVLVMRRPMTLTDTSERETVRVAPGDTVYVLSPVGEGYTRLWVRGKIVVEEEFWAPPGQDDPADPAFKARLLRDADSKWWVKVRTRTGRLGWIDMDQARETGADACG